MKKIKLVIKVAILGIGLFYPGNLPAQNQDFPEKLFENYEKFKEEKITQRRFKHSDIQPLIEGYKDNPNFTVQKLGESIEGRRISLISIGKGDVEVLLWSQMHGDESTATMALFDIFRFFNSAGFEEEKQEILQNVRLHFLPMLNPDGAQVFKRRNKLGVDVNRDALRLQAPESRILKRARDSLKADFGFNLHDQSKYYNVEHTEKPATISFLAPAYNFEKSINEVRGNAMKIIVVMNEVLQDYAPGQVGKYNDDFEPRAFGDNIQKWGTSTVLIESGGYLNDPEKQEIRKLNFIAILSAIRAIANKTYREKSIEAYEEIPNNDRKLFDLKITGLTYEKLSGDYILDLGINHDEIDYDGHTDFYYKGSIADQGDLSTHYAYRNFDASGYQLKPGGIYPETFENLENLEEKDLHSFLSLGYAYVRVRNLPEDKDHVSLPVNVVAEDFERPEDLSPDFFLEKNGNFEYAVINGFLVDLDENPEDILNALILR